MEIVGLFILWLVMALTCGMVAQSRKGGGWGLIYFVFGLIFWPLALVSALLLRERKEQPARAEGVIGGKPYWRAKGQFCAMIDGKEVAFPTMEMLNAALAGGEYNEPSSPEDELIGQRLLRRIKEL